MIAVPVQPAVPVPTAVPILAAAMLRQPDQVENQAVRQNINQALQKAGKRWISKHF